VIAARGKSPDEILYVLDMGAVGGLFSYTMAADIERRLVHRQGFVLRHLSRHPVDGEIAMSLPREDGTIGLKITRADGLFGEDVSLSDSIEDAPCWHADGTVGMVAGSELIEKIVVLS